MNIAEITTLENYIVRIKAEDGRVGWLDVTPYLACESFAPLKSQSEFERVRNGKYFIEWDCGADLSADTIEAHWKIEPHTPHQQTQKLHG